MIVKLENKLLQQSLENKKILSFLKLLHSLTELNKHQFYFEGVDLDLFKSIFSDNIELEYNYLQNAYENISYIVIVCSTEIIEQKITDFSERGITYKTYNQGKRLFVEKGDFINDFITWELIDSYLNQPLQIVLEDNESDKLFIIKCLTFLGGLNVSELEQNNQLFFPLGGGSKVPAVLENINGRNRVVCIVDSDKKFPEEVFEPKSMQQKVINMSSNFGYTYHILEKSEMENYLPDNAIKQFLKETNRNEIDFAYFNFDEIHKDFFDMKDGLKANHKNQIFWTDYFEFPIQTEKERKNAKLNGFGDKIYEAFNHVTTKEELKSRDKNGELEVIVKKIKQLI